MGSPRVLIVTPVFNNLDGYGQIPEGISRLRRYLQKKGIAVDVAACGVNIEFERPNEPWFWLSETTNIIKEGREIDLSGYTLIAVSLVSEEHATAIGEIRHFLQELRKKAGDLPFVAGGFGVWQFPFQVAGKYENLDFVVNKWGEIPVSYLAEKIKFYDIRHPLGEKEFKKIFLDHYPPKGIFTRYLRKGNPCVFASGGWEEIPQEALCFYDGKKENLKITTQLGCAYGNCTFCQWARSTKHRQLPVEWVLKNIETANPQEVRIFDACFLYRGCKKSIEILEGIKRLREEGKLREDFRLKYECRADAFPQEKGECNKLLQLMEDACTKVVFVGLESGSERVLREFKKGTVRAGEKKGMLLEQNVRAIDALAKRGFEGGCYFILSSPHSELVDVIKTLELIAYLAKASPTLNPHTNPSVMATNREPFCLDKESVRGYRMVWPQDPLAAKIALSAHIQIKKSWAGTTYEKYTTHTTLRALKNVSSLIEQYMDEKVLNELVDEKYFTTGDNFEEKLLDPQFRENMKEINLRIWKEYIKKGRYHSEWKKGLTFAEAAKMENEKLKRMLETDNREELRDIMLGKLDEKFEKMLKTQK